MERSGARRYVSMSATGGARPPSVPQRAGPAASGTAKAMATVGAAKATGAAAHGQSHPSPGSWAATWAPPRETATLSPADVASLWKRYKETGDEDIRNRLIERYLPLVRYAAERLFQKLPQNVELDDLMSAGIFGLIDAIDGFDLARGVKFETYCTTRIRGAILDELRSFDWVPRLVRTRAHKLEHVLRQLEVDLGRSPTDVEVAGSLGMTLGEFDALVREANAVTVVSLSDRYAEKDDTKALRKIDVLEDKKGEDPVLSLQRKDVLELATKGLSIKEQLILLLYYFEDLTMREIGLSLNLSESRVCQLHSRIMTNLRRELVEVKSELLDL